ncbi:hypothetical protein ASPZODRAFT_19870 [Penicilliopsis zonata CBS 506.65]|uniref:Tc toxin complex TcA C-terminal TcB-binding domain-containing protein n=1 Tax=Penicilliopsis zonata CBS 506.65 TaxID=1073090 RepID=A0A1L9S6U9_9EURO|nr:hypothetical protein ASPZODRAFT_19870 [Penicilliopsis zonata CBS 506.65]OJJ42889.1 hypothetical protein ASPZODRAFT_19870 [Penicilliopsis zonata CBS 506.65]
MEDTAFDLGLTQGLSQGVAASGEIASALVALNGHLPAFLGTVELEFEALWTLRSRHEIVIASRPTQYTRQLKINLADNRIKANNKKIAVIDQSSDLTAAADPLCQLGPASFLKLQITGEMIFSLPEELFDIDFPQYHFRRTKFIAVSVHCIVYSPALMATCAWTSTCTGPAVRRMQLTPAWLTPSQPSPSAAVTPTPAFELIAGAVLQPFEGAGVVSTYTLTARK